MSCWPVTTNAAGKPDKPGATGGSVRLVTGGSAGTYDLLLPGTSGAWADSDQVTAYLSTLADTDAIAWLGKLAAGTLSICTRTVVDDPD